MLGGTGVLLEWLPVLQHGVYWRALWKAVITLCSQLDMLRLLFGRKAFR